MSLISSKDTLKFSQQSKNFFLGDIEENMSEYFFLNKV